MRLSLAAKLMGCSRTQAYRRLRQYAVFSDGPGSRLEVDSARVYKFIANERIGKDPMVPELAAILEKLTALDEANENVAAAAGRTQKLLVKIATRMGIDV
jgi:hypothetical protein